MKVITDYARGSGTIRVEPISSSTPLIRKQALTVRCRLKLLLHRSTAYNVVQCRSGLPLNRKISILDGDGPPTWDELTALYDRQDVC